MDENNQAPNAQPEAPIAPQGQSPLASPNIEQPQEKEPPDIVPPGAVFVTHSPTNGVEPIKETGVPKAPLQPGMPPVVPSTVQPMGIPVNPEPIKAQQGTTIEPETATPPITTKPVVPAKVLENAPQNVSSADLEQDLSRMADEFEELSHTIEKEVKAGEASSPTLGGAKVTPSETPAMSDGSTLTLGNLSESPQTPSPVVPPTAE